MPFLLPAAASAVAAAAPAAAAGAASAGIGATLTSIAGNVLLNVAISAAMSVFQPQVGVAGRTFEWTLDPDGPIPFAAGRIGVPGSAVYRKTFGPDLMYYGIPSVLSGAGPIDGYEAFLADDESVTFDGSGKAVSSQYAGELWYKTKLGTQPDTAITSPTGLKNGATLPGWTSAHRLSGKACYMIVMGENSKGTAFPTGEIKPLITLRGLKGWDPRRDSTYPGGSGPCRLNDPSTWVYLRRGPLWGLKWALGLWEGPVGKGAPQVDYQVGGIGAKLRGIDVPSFVAAENLADLYDWTCAAYPTTDDDKYQVLNGFLQSAGCIYAQVAGKISCIQRAAPRTSIVTISAYDTAGPLEIDTAASRIDRINTLRPRFWSEPHRWQMTALDQEVTAQAYRDDDGAVRTRGIDYPYVTNARQAGQLAALQIANTREGIAGVIPLKPHLQRIRPGDAFTITEAGFVLNGLKCLCLNTDYDPATGVVRVSFVSETDAKYPFALGQNPTPPEPQVLTPVDPRFVSPPGAGDWTITPRPPAPGGGQLPGFDLGGIVSNDTATSIIVEYGPTDDGPWKQAYEGPPTVTNIPIDGLQSGATYYIAIQYRRDNNYSERHVYGPYTAPILDPGPSAPSIVNLQDQVTAAFGDIFDVSELLGQARTDIDAQGVEIAAARGGQANLNSRIVQVNQARIDGDTSNAQAIALVQARTANTEADIIDLENALATETGARAEAIEQVTARSITLPNLIKNGDFRNGLNGYTQSGSGWIIGTAGGPGAAYAFCAADGQQDLWTDFYPVGTNLSVSFLGSRSGAGVSLNVLVEWWNSSTGFITYGTISSVPQGGFQRILIENDARPTNADRFRILARKLGTGGNVAFTLLKVNTGAYATAWSDDADAKAIEASVTQQSLAIIDLENQQNIALFRVKSEASGSRPAIIEAYSGLGISAVAFSAEQIYLGDNTVFDDATNTWQTIDGSTVYIRAEGAPFGAFNNLREWWGPTGIALGAMTPDNGYSGRMTTAPYNFTNTLNPKTFSAYASPGSIEAHRANAGSLTSAAVSILYQNAKGAVTVTWERLIGGVTAAGTAVIDAPNQLTTTFTKTVSAQERTDTVFQATLTDAGSGERRQVIVPVVFTSGAA